MKRAAADEVAFLQSMHQVGGNWTRLEDRGPLNINEHVNFYAKACRSHLLYNNTNPVDGADML